MKCRFASFAGEGETQASTWNSSFLDLRGGYAPPQHDPTIDSFILRIYVRCIGLGSGLLDAELKKAYRAKVLDFSPDNSRSKNLPDESLFSQNDQLAKSTKLIR